MQRAMLVGGICLLSVLFCLELVKRIAYLSRVEEQLNYATYSYRLLMFRV